MIIETLTSGAAALVLDAQEMDTDAEKGQLCALVRRVQREHGMQAWKSMDARLFVNGSSVLLMAWPTEARCCLFPDFETLLRAALNCPEDLPSALACLDKRWMLLIRCPYGRAPLPLYEYGESVPVSEALAVHIAEHGELILAENAVETLRQRFL